MREVNVERIIQLYKTLTFNFNLFITDDMKHTSLAFQCCHIKNKIDNLFK